MSRIATEELDARPAGLRPSTPAATLLSPRRLAAIFAAKTTASALLALWVAFAFNLDQPKWALLTVFIVAQPQSGQVLAKSFYRIVGTLVGAAVALLLVSLFAQERVLFPGALALWIAVCTFASRYFRNFASYAFVLSGYTAAIVGIPGTLEPGGAFYIAQARLTEISLGIIATAAISHVVLPERLAASLCRTIARSRAALVDGALALLEHRDVRDLISGVAPQVIAIESLRASAVFEDRAIRDRSGAIRRLGAAMLAVIDAAWLLDRRPDEPGACLAAVPDLQPASRKSAAAIELWRDGKLDARALRFAFARASAELPLGRDLYLDPIAADHDVVRGAAAVGHLRNFLTAFAAFVEAHDAFLVPELPQVAPACFAVSNDPLEALWAGVRAALALAIASTFWVLADWPQGPTAAIFASAIAALFATTDRATETVAKSAALFALLTVPCFVVVEILLADTSGFAMLCLVLGPLLFVIAWLLAHPPLAGLGFASAVYFTNVAGLQDRMAYDPVAFVNTSLALIFAGGLTAVLFAIVAPDTPEAQRHRVVKVMRRQFERIARTPHIGSVEFATTTVEALDRLRRVLPADRAGRAIDAGLALLSAGIELIRVRDEGRMRKADAAIASHIASLLGRDDEQALESALRAARDASLECLADLRDGRLGVAAARAAARNMYAFAAAGDDVERSRVALEARKSKEEPIHVA